MIKIMLLFYFDEQHIGVGGRLVTGRSHLLKQTRVMRQTIMPHVAFLVKGLTDNKVGLKNEVKRLNKF